MITYTTGRPDIKRYIVYQLLGIILGFVFLLAWQYLFPLDQVIKRSTYLMFGIVTFLTLFFEIKRERVYEIKFDHDKQLISFSYKTSAFSKLKKYDLPYEVARVERSENTALVKWLWPPSVYFLKNKLEIFEISKRKDGFTKADLNEIYKTCVEIYLMQKNSTYA